MKETYLTGTEAVFTRTGPLSKSEQALLEQGQEPAVRARYTHFDCRVHGVFRIDNELGLDAPTCPRRRKDCQVREVFDPAAYVEYYGMSNPKYHPDPEPKPGPNKLTAEQERQLDEVLALADGPARDDDTIRREMERILGVSISTSAQEMLDALREGLGGLLTPKPEKVTRISQCLPPDWQEQEQADDDAPKPPDEPVLTDIEHYASLMMSAREVCIILGLDYEVQQHLPEFQEQMQRGRLIQEAQQRATIFLHAKNGSAPAQEMADKFIRRAAIARAGSNEES